MWFSRYHNYCCSFSQCFSVSAATRTASSSLLFRFVFSTYRERNNNNNNKKIYQEVDFHTICNRWFNRRRTSIEITCFEAAAARINRSILTPIWWYDCNIIFDPYQIQWTKFNFFYQLCADSSLFSVVYDEIQVFWCLVSFFSIFLFFLALPFLCVSMHLFLVFGKSVIHSYQLKLIGWIESVCLLQCFFYRIIYGLI